MHAGLGDDRAAVGVADEHDGARQGVEHLADPLRVAVQVGELAVVLAVARQVDGDDGQAGGASSAITRSQDHAPCHAPCTSTTVTSSSGTRGA